MSITGSCLESCPLQQQQMDYEKCYCDPNLIKFDDFCQCPTYFVNGVCSLECDLEFINESTKQCQNMCQYGFAAGTPKICTTCNNQYINRTTQQCQQFCTQINHTFSYFQVISYCEELTDFINCPTLNGTVCYKCA